MQAPLVVVVLAAGKGTRMRSSLPKVLHPIAGRPMIQHVLEAAAALDPAQMVVVVGPEDEAITECVRPHPVVVQQRQLGTADAVQAAREIAAPLVADGADVLVLYGDGPLITPATLARMRQARQESDDAFVWLGFRPPDPTGYGRLLLADCGRLTAIVEEGDASEEE
ncbi:MAG TPA: NTP transferase domain-containing protein, partial [Kiloniellales bacterium]|nr:NTP transferase domain-containing protein [Kiloniellales bacterium]